MAPGRLARVVPNASTISGTNPRLLLNFGRPRLEIKRVVNRL